MGTNIRWVNGENLLRCCLGLVELAPPDQQSCKLKLRLRVVGGQRDSFHEFAVRCLGVLQAEVGSGELIVRLGEPGIDLNNIAELDHCFLVLPLAEICLTAIEVPQFLFVGITNACRREQYEREEETEFRAKDLHALYAMSSANQLTRYHVLVHELNPVNGVWY